ncbi:MAG: glutamine-hydrolyzing GMP synthase [Firmicutes bacterium]|nr:glutamine-hydrolyzing GMP synthase [Bacillota bacterium]
MPLLKGAVVVDFAGRRAQDIARLVREMNFYSEVWPAFDPPERFVADRPPGVIVAGEAGDAGVRALAAALHAAGIPALVVEGDATGSGLAARIESFLKHECGLTPDWTVERFIDEQVAAIRAAAGEAGAIVCGLSGGVDSSVAAALVHRAVGDRLHTIFVNTGLMRAGEPERVEAAFRERFGPNFRHVDASARFLGKLAGVTDPEHKRRVIGEEFIRVFEEEARSIGDVRYLVQGTVYPDVIESGVGGGLVKSHHNVGGLPERMALELIEPLRYLFKDEVRRLGEALGLPRELVWRHPFPGPGLAVRVLGEVTPERVEIARRCDAIVTDELRRAGLMDDLWQAFAVLTEARTVGVRDDTRTYGYVAAVRTVTSRDAMSADWGRIPYDVLDAISRRILNEVPAIGRVVYDISPKPPSTIEWE